MPDAKGSTTSISAKIDGVLFRTAGTIITELGWKAAWGNLEEAPESKKDSEDDDGDTNRVMPPVTDGQPAVDNQVDVLSKTTRPPPPLPEATSLTAMTSDVANNHEPELPDLPSNGILVTQATPQNNPTTNK